MYTNKKKQYSKIQNYYETIYHQAAEETFPHDVKRYEKWFDHKSFEELKHEGNMLDFGCGAGFVCKMLLNKGYEVYGVDISEMALQIAKQYVPEGHFDLSNEDGSLDFEDEFFSLITSFGVIEHLEQPEKTIQECFRTSKPGARAIFMVPNKKSPYFWFNHGTGQIYEKPRTKKEWEALFCNQGYEIIDVQRDPGPSLEINKSMSQKIKFVAHKFMNVLPINFTYQFIFYLKK